MKNDVTIGIFTYHRPKLLNRQLQFFKDLGYNFRIILLDGSEDSSSQTINQSLSKKFNIEYINIIDAKERYYFFANALDSEFAAFCSDDDLIVPSFYKSGASFLKENNQYSVVAGKIYTLHYHRLQPWKGYYLRNYLGNGYDFFYGDFVERIIRKDQAYALGCPPSYYGVRRFDNVQLYCKHMHSLKLFSSMERLENICNLLHGGMKVLDVFMGFRDYSSEPIRQSQRDDPETYISKDDMMVLQDIIRNELKDKIQNKELLEYFASYAWPIPLRPAQSKDPNDKRDWKLRIESFLNLFIAHRFHAFDKTITKAMRKNMLKYSVQ